MTFKRILAVAVAVLVGGHLQSADANLLTNGDFEAGGTGWINAAGNDFSTQDWANGAPGDGGAPPVYGQVGDGQLGLAATPWIDNDNATEEFSQTVAGTVGLTYEFTIQTHVGANFLPFAGGPVGGATGVAADSAFLFIRFLDSGGGTISSVDQVIDENNAIQGSLPPPGAENSADWQDWSLQGVAPAGTVEVQVGGGFVNGRDAGGPEGAMRFDNAALVPEPGSLALLGVGTLLVAVRRRRRN